MPILWFFYKMPQYDALVSGIIMHQNYFTKNFLFVQQQILLVPSLFNSIFEQEIDQNFGYQERGNIFKITFSTWFLHRGKFYFFFNSTTFQQKQIFSAFKLFFIECKIAKEMQFQFNSKQNKIIRLAEDIRDRLQSKHQKSLFSFQ